MTAAEALRSAIAAHESALADLRAALALLEGETEAPAPDEWLTTGVAAKVARVSVQSIRRWAVEFGTGERTPSGTWRHRRSAVLSVAQCQGQRERNVAVGERNVAVGDLSHRDA